MKHSTNACVRRQMNTKKQTCNINIVFEAKKKQNKSVRASANRANRILK